MREQKLTPGWFSWCTGDGEQIGKRHYFRIVLGNPQVDDFEEAYKPLCGSKPKDAYAVDNLPPFREGEKCQRCVKLLPLYMPRRRNHD